MRPFFASERYGSAPYRNCRGSSGFFATMVATDNEANLNGFERHRGKAARAAVLKAGWKAFATQTPPDSNGWADQGDVILMHRAMWGSAMPYPSIGHWSPSGIWQRIGDYAVSMAIDTRVLAASNAVRRYVSGVPHQGVAWQRKTINGERFVKWMCPMHPPSDTYTGHWVKWASIKKAGLALGDGGIYVELYPASGWTAEALARKDCAARVTRKNERIDELRDSLSDASATAASLTREVAALTEQLAECRDDKCAAEVEAVLDRYDEVTTELRAAL